MSDDPDYAGLATPVAYVVNRDDEIDEVMFTDGFE